MRSAALFTILRKAAEISGRTQFVVIGSQAIHGTVPDPDIEAVAASNDVDLYPVDGYTPMIYEELMLHLGQDSDFHIETDTYIEAVSTTLARFPNGWEARARRMSAGAVSLNGRPVEVSVLFPNIYDLTVSKVAIRRKKTSNSSTASSPSGWSSENHCSNDTSRHLA
jgi:hypothetical protein